MNALFGVGFVSGIVYGLLVDGTYFKIYAVILLFYTVVFNFILIDRTHFTKRKNINVTSWNGNLHNLYHICSPCGSKCLYYD